MEDVEKIEPQEPDHILKVSELTAERKILFGDDHIALRNVSFTIKAGEIVACCGESGCGKSILTRAVVGCLDPKTKIVSGRIMLGDEDLLTKNRREMRRVRCSRIGFIDRSIKDQLTPDITVRQHLRETLQLAERLDELGEEKEWGPLFYEVGIVEPELVLSQKCGQLAPLMTQRVMLLTTLFSGAELLICDEPTSELDDVAEMYFYEVLCQIRDERKLGILLTCNYLKGIDRIANQIHLMCEGGILESGEGRNFLQEPKYNYTKELINCTPDINQTRKRLTGIAKESTQEAEKAVHEKSSVLKIPPVDLDEAE